MQENKNPRRFRPQNALQTTNLWPNILGHFKIDFTVILRYFLAKYQSSLREVDERLR